MAGVATAGAAALMLTGCGAAPTASSTASASASNYTACMVTDVGGIDDKSFNTSAWEGLQEAAKDQRHQHVKYVASKAEADYEPNLTRTVQPEAATSSWRSVA